MFAIAILTWWDLVRVDGTKHADILTVNFKTFMYLLSISGNNLDLLTDAIKTLRKTFCSDILTSDTFYDGNESVRGYRQLQTELLPPRNMRAADFRNLIVAETAGDLQSFSEDWQEQLKGDGVTYHFY